MKISEVTCFALKSDGTLLIKTEMETPDDSFRYCFYIYRGSEVVHKSPYDKKSFLVYKVDQFGKYKIKAFVRNSDGSQKENLSIEYTVNRSNAEKLLGDEAELVNVRELVLTAAPLQAAGKFRLNVEGKLPSDGEYAWYIYPAGQTEPVYRGSYARKPELDYEFTQKGDYKAKLFVKAYGDKYTLLSDVIHVE